MQCFDWDGEPEWSFVYSGPDHHQHHDAVQLPNGNVVFIAFERKTGEEALAAGRDPEFVADAGEVHPDTLIEINPWNGEIVWEWRVWDHLVQDFDPDADNHGVPEAHPELVDINVTSGMNEADWNHLNAIAYNAELDQLVVTSAFLGEIWIIDHSTTTAEAAGHSGGLRGRGGDLLYRWSGLSAPSTSNAPQHPSTKHDGTWIADGLPGAGNLLVFDNDPLGGSPESVVVELELPLLDDGWYERAQTVWSFAAEGFYAPFVSGAQRLAGGNTLVTDGPAGRIFEVTPEGDIVWEYVSPVIEQDILGPFDPIPENEFLGTANMVFDAAHYTADSPGLAGRYLTPGDPLEGPAD